MLNIFQLVGNLLHTAGFYLTFVFDISRFGFNWK